MPDENATRAELAAETAAETANVENQNTETVEDFDKNRAMQTIEKLRGFEKEAAKLKKQLAAYEAKEIERKQAEMTETERLRAQLDETEKAKRYYEMTALKLQAALDAGLPVELAARLTGETPDELKADAEALAKLLPAAQKTPPKIQPTSPGDATGESQEMKIRRLRNRAANIWATGGGVGDIIKPE